MIKLWREDTLREIECEDCGELFNYDDPASRWFVDDFGRLELCAACRVEFVARESSWKGAMLEEAGMLLAGIYYEVMFRTLTGLGINKQLGRRYVRGLGDVIKFIGEMWARCERRKEIVARWLEKVSELDLSSETFFSGK